MKLKDKMVKEIMEEITFNLRDNYETLDLLVNDKADKYFNQLYYENKIKKETDLLVTNFKIDLEHCIYDEWAGDMEDVDYFVRYKILEGLNSREDNLGIFRKFLREHAKQIVDFLEEETEEDV